MAKPTKTTTKTKTESTTSAPPPPMPAIPLAVRGSAPQSGADMLAELAGEAVAPVRQTSDKADRPELKLSKEDQAEFTEFVSVKELEAVVTARSKALGSSIEEKLMEAWTRLAFSIKGKPENPVVKVYTEDGTLDCESLFVVQNRFKQLQIPDPQKPVQSLTNLLISIGLDPKKAAELVAAEIKFVPQVSVRSFNELVGEKASDAEKAVGTKILEFVKSLSAEERALAIDKTPTVEVVDGFLNRLTHYVDTSEQLGAVLQVVPPVLSKPQAKFAMSASPVEKVERLQGVANKLIGERTEKKKK